MVFTGALLFSPLLELWVLVAHLALPAREVDGYVRDAKGKPLRYRLNGIPVLVATVVAWAALCYSGLLPWDYLYRHAGTTCAMASAAGFLVTLALVLPAPPGPESPGLATDLFLGRVLNPRRRVAGSGGPILDAKMYLYLIGAVHLQLNILSYTAAHFLSSSSSSSSPVHPGAPLAAAMLTWFVVEYLYFEDVHLYTYDFFAERVGAKLTWGCLCFYPFFYALPVYAAVGVPPSPVAAAAGSRVYHVASVVVFVAGWSLSRGANLQKFWFKQAQQSRERRPGSGDGGDGAAKTVRSADGRKKLLCGGLWGLARHVNYLGEILEAVGIAMAATAGVAAGATGGGWLPVWTAWLYPLYYVGLLVPRERDDDALCRGKYGVLWEEYCRRVPWRIVPYLY